MGTQKVKYMVDMNICIYLITKQPPDVFEKLEE
jgi:predicted nucleic acid-binding protein